MRARALACAGALWIAGCLYPEYGVTHDGGALGAGGRGGAGAGGRGGSAAGVAGVGGNVGLGGSAIGAAGAGGMAGSAAGRGGSAAGTGGSAGSVGSAGSGGAAAGGGASAGRGGTTGTGGSTAGSGGGLAGRGGATGAGGSAGTVGTGGTTARGGSGGGTAGSMAGTGGGAAGRGGTTGVGGSAGTVGTGGSSAGGATAAPNWLPSIAVVYQFDMDQGTIGVEAHGDETLHLEEQGTFLPAPDTVAIEGRSVKLSGPLAYPTYLQSKTGAGLPSVFRTEPGSSFTTGGWFRITASTNQQWLIQDGGSTSFENGGFYFYVDQNGGKLANNAAYAYCRVGVHDDIDPDFDNYKDVATPTSPGTLGFDPVAGNSWIHLVCRYNAQNGELAIFAGGVARGRQVDTVHGMTSGPGPFMLGCNEASSCGFIGNMDEVFFAPSALADYDINRIYACGIDGSRCRCSGSSYYYCGYANPQCSNLPLCSSTTP